MAYVFLRVMNLIYIGNLVKFWYQNNVLAIRIVGIGKCCFGGESANQSNQTFFENNLLM